MAVKRGTKQKTKEGVRHQYHPSAVSSSDRVNQGDCKQGERSLWFPLKAIIGVSDRLSGAFAFVVGRLNRRPERSWTQQLMIGSCTDYGMAKTKANKELCEG